MVIDFLTKMVHFIPFKGLLNAKDIAQLFLDQVFHYHSMVLALVSYRLIQFQSRFWKPLFWFLNIKVNLFLVHHPATNRETEKNQLFQEYMRCYCIYNQEN